MFSPYPTSSPAPSRMGGGPRSIERSVSAMPVPEVRKPTGRPRPARSWRDKVRHAVDLTVAFMTLEDAVPPAPESDSERVDEVALPGRPADRPARVSVDVVHAHRQPLRPLPRSRRPGAGMSRPQICIAPVRDTPAPPKRRSRAA
jgi:hypothetical protein